MYKTGLVMRSDKRSRDGLSDILRNVGASHITMVEVGSYQGESAEVFLATGLVDRIYCIDPWKQGYDDSDIASTSDMAAAEAEFDSKFADDPRVVKVKGTIDDFVREYSAVLGSIDGVYIDACHTYDCVVHDISVTLDSIRPSRFIAGHDYGRVRPAVTATLGDVHDRLCDDSWVVYVGPGVNHSRGSTAPERSALVWASDGGDFAYARYSIASMRLRLGDSCDFFVLATPDADLHGLDTTYGVTRIDPSPYLQALHFDARTYGRLGRSWVFVVLYRLIIPLVARFTEYKNVLYLDGDTLALPDSSRSPADLLSYDAAGYEVAGVPDMYLSLYLRNKSLLDGSIFRGEFRDELARRVWRPWGTVARAYVNAGVLLWNSRNIDRAWYIRRCHYFWDNVSRFSYNDQDFVNSMLCTDASIPSVFNAEFSGGGAYSVDGACIRHCTGPGKTQMQRAGRRILEFSIAARFEQAGTVPYANPLPMPGGRKCIAWCCDSSSRYAELARRSALSVSDKCGSALHDVARYVLVDSGGSSDVYLQLAARVAAPGVSVIDVSDLVTALGIRTVDDWRSGRLWYSPGKLLRLVIPFVPELAGYDVTLYMDADTEVVDPAFSTVFDIGLAGYDCAMAGEFDISRGLVRPFYRVGFGRAFVRTSARDERAVSSILTRLNAGVYFNSGVFLANMAEMRRTFGSVGDLASLLDDAVRRGAPAVWHDVYNYVCNVTRLPGRYNAFARTRDIGEQSYCVHDQGRGKKWA